ncbi:MAG: DUF1566 domain-containing protein, partial [Thermodesulfovibrionales bacterium]|nr:DUF1566 domain-containing protein [Thermodesulfovibrionales bacterium]
MKRVILICMFILAMLIFSFNFVEASGSGGAISLPKTGQGISYATGDDGDLKTGVNWPGPRFEDMGNGTTKDNLTGLIWLKNANCFGTQAWAVALNSANTLANGQCGLTDNSQAGDWRLPNINELKSLVNIGYKEGGMCDGYPCDYLAMWLNYNNFNNMQNNYYWSSTTYTATPITAWIINMQNGNAGGYVKTAQTYVLPVRGGQSGIADPIYPANIPKTGQETCYGEDGNTITCDATGQDGHIQKGVSWPSPRFSITYCNNSGPCSNQGSDCDANPNNDIVKDNLTGLTWLRDGSLGGQLSWANALSYANSLTLCGMSGWRLPNVNERVSLMNFGQTDMAAWLNTQQFVNVPSSYFWTSSTNAANTANAWYTAMAGGAISGLQDKTTLYYVWPVKTSCIPPPSNMVSWWRAEDNASDSVGTNHGTLINGATYATGKVGKAFSLDGVDDYVKVPDSILWDFETNDFTIDA